MTFDEQFRPAFDNLTARLRRDVARHLDAAVEELTATAQKAAATTEAEHTASVEQAVRQARAGAEQAAAGRLAAGLADAETRAAERAAAAAADAERMAAERLTAAVADAERIAAERLAAAVADAERTAAERLAAAVTEAETRMRRTSDERDIMAGERLVAAIGTIDTGQSLSEILNALATAAAAETSRVAIFLTADSQFKSWRFEGFEPAFTVSDDLQLSSADAGMMADAVLSRLVVHAGSDAVAFAPPFADLPSDRSAVAVPLVVDDEVVGVVYADQGTAGTNDRASWAAAIEVLARHASRSLEALTAQRLAKTLSDRAGIVRPRTVKAVTPAVPVSVVEPPVSSSTSAPAVEDQNTAAQRYARLLVSDIKLHYEPDVIAGVRERDLMQRLGGEIARAWTLYEARVPESIRTATNYFHAEMVRTLANGDASLLSPTP
jgi:hypothetical protein